MNVQVLLDLARTLQFTDLVFRHIQQLESFTRTGDKIFRTLLNFLICAFFEHVQVVQGQQVFLLTGHQLR